MRRFLLTMLAAAGSAAICSAADFAPPVQLKADGKAIRVEAPGYAYPCWADVDGDGKPELVVGQFNKGKMNVFKQQSDGKFAKGMWLEVEGKPAEVPGVW